MRHPFPLISITCAYLLLTHGTRANNIQVTNPTLTGNTGTSALVQFDLSWENSWRGGGVSNWDAAWVFVKYRTIGGVWQHVLLNNTGHTAPVGCMIDMGLLIPGGTPYDANTNPVIGTFIRRSADGNGTFAITGVQLRWNYGTQGLAYNDIAQVQVFAIEMCAVLQGAFAAGSGGTETSAFTLTTINTGSPLVAPSGTGSLGGQAGGYPTGQTAPTSSSWPNGFNAFYCMKYEVTQQGYVDFLNTLTYTQQAARGTWTPTGAAGSSTPFNRHSIDIQITGVASTTPAVYGCNLNDNSAWGEATDGKDIACNLLSWGDLSAYLDWSGLRPMTELEFEKACRGPLPPQPFEYPWGTTTIAANPFALTNSGASNEGVATNYSTTAGNASYNTTDGALDGPLRTGIFAANGSNTGRVSAGASYYGIMELGGNVYERPINISTVNGRAFAGTHGNGSLTASGDPDVSTWPEAGTADGSGFRGGTLLYGAQELCVSFRGFASSTPINRQFHFGGRGVRSAP